MKVDGKLIAETIFTDLQKRVITLKTRNITPQVAIILVGNDPASESYVRQKVKKTEMIGGVATMHNFPQSASQSEVLELVERLNRDTSVHGVIIQRPLPRSFDLEVMNQAVTPQKDIDAFHMNSPFVMPLAQAVLVILEHIYSSSKNNEQNVISWLQNKSIVVFGKGETGGGPILELFKQKGLNPVCVDSKTKTPKEATKTADIIITAVGKRDILTADMIKKNVILLNVGMHREEDGKLHGDYEENDIDGIASFFTPTPGGVGPVNVACLLENLLQATEIQYE